MSTLAEATRRADPKRIHQAPRIAVRNSLTDYSMSLQDAERWCDAWEDEASIRKLPCDANYWTVGDAWIAEQRAGVSTTRKWHENGPDSLEEKSAPGPR